MTGGPSEAPFRVTVLRRRGQGVLRLAGELDFASVGQLASAIEEVVAGDAPGTVTVEVEQLEFADIVGLRPLFELAERMQPGAVRVTGARRPVARVFHLLNRDDLLA